MVSNLMRFLLVFVLPFALAGADSPEITAALRQHCFACHGKTAMGGINLLELTSKSDVESIGDKFAVWEKVAAVLEEKRMPPAKMPQPTAEQRAESVQWIRTRLNEYSRLHSGDPGRVMVRRLTSGEYGYTIKDITGLDLKFDRDFASDSVGGEGFTNFGDVQFMDNANLERYLSAAKQVASHAVTGAGPLFFYADPGKSGMEISAIHRIEDIYRKYGFRSVSGEGGKPFGMDRYRKAFYAAWRYQQRRALGEPRLTLAEAAKAEGQDAKFVGHLLSVLQRKHGEYPMNEMLDLWRAMPATDRASARKGAEALELHIVNWPKWLFAMGAEAEGGQGDERALVLSEELLDAKEKIKLRFNLRRAKGASTARGTVFVASVNPAAKDQPQVIFRNGSIRFRSADRKVLDPVPLEKVLTEQSRERLKFGVGANGEAIDPGSFVLAGNFLPGKDVKLAIDVQMPEGAMLAEFTIEATLGAVTAGDAVIRVAMSDKEELMMGVPVSGMLGKPNGEGFKKWEHDVLAYAAEFPQNSNSEAAPADKDPIPQPFNNAYNQQERDLFHQVVKYYRRDDFFREKMIDAETRQQLDVAWTDLLYSFDYHEGFKRFVSDKYKLGITKNIAQLTREEIEQFPAEPRQYLLQLKTEFDAIHARERQAEPRHLEDCLSFAESAWRRPLTPAEKDRLRRFYTNAREVSKLDHDKAIQSLLARILVAPAFLYRLEDPGSAALPTTPVVPVGASRSPSSRPLGALDLASRLSYFLWSSVPDEELKRAAKSGELATNAGIEKQVRRMLADPKARRLSTEFFGQWLGFYRFDQFTGVDTSRYPEFTEEVKTAMYDEAVSFFEYIVRQGRPLNEMLAADYTFLNQPLAKHYQLKTDVKNTGSVVKVDGAKDLGRGGMLRLGAVLTTTSAPLRTSPVKRGDWLLRRILGTPTPPPPADAGSIPADDKNFGGLSLKQKLAAHQRNATCAGCHSRIDPLGFPLEGFDAVGRARAQYADGKKIEDTSEMAGKGQIAGVEGLIRYLQSEEKQVLKTFSKKLLGYALGRTVQGSDQELVQQLVAKGGNASFADVATLIAVSPQFRQRRVEPVDPATTPSRQVAAAGTRQTGNMAAGKIGVDR